MTPKDHQDRLQLQIALTELDTLTHRLNDTKRDSENRLEAKRLLSHIGGRHSFRVDNQEVYMIRHDDIVEVVCIAICLFSHTGLHSWTPELFFWFFILILFSLFLNFYRLSSYDNVVLAVVILSVRLSVRQMRVL